MRHGKIKGLVLAVAVLAGTVALVAPNAGAAPDCNATVTIADANADEGKLISFPVVISAAPKCQASASLSYTTTALTGENDVAEPDADYIPKAGWLELNKPAGTASATESVKVLLKADDDEEEAEVFRVWIFDVHGAATADNRATGRIVDVDSVECVICTWGPCPLSYALTAASTIPVTLGYATVDGRARAGEDFAGVRDGQLTIPAGATRGVLMVDVFRNSPGEPAEEFYVVITSVSAGRIVGSGRTEVHILPD